MVAVGARMHTKDQAATLVDTFLATPFSNGERHVRRLKLLADYEASTGQPPRTALGRSGRAG